MNAATKETLKFEELVGWSAMGKVTALCSPQCLYIARHGGAWRRVGRCGNTGAARICITFWVVIYSRVFRKASLIVPLL